MLDKKQIQVIFLFEFKVRCKTAETTNNIKKAFDPGTANKHATQQLFRKFCKGDESLDNEECSNWASEVDSDQLRASIGADPLAAAREVAKALSVSHSAAVQHLKQVCR